MATDENATDNAALGKAGNAAMAAIAEASSNLETMRTDAQGPRGRALSVAQTKLDEARLWLTEAGNL